MISKELVALAKQQNKSNYAHIGSLAGAYQYLLLYKLVNHYLKKGTKVLDWGTGIGHFSYYLCRQGYKTVGFSMESFSFKNWVKGCDYEFIRGKENEPTRLPFKDKSFDAVVSVGVLEHVGEFGGQEIASMKEITRILRPQGIFICYHLPNYYSLTEHFSKVFKNKFHHQDRFKEEDIKELITQSGLKLIKIGRYGLLPRNSLVRLPLRLRYSKQMAIIWDTLDQILGIIFSPICQNYYFVAEAKD